MSSQRLARDAQIPAYEPGEHFGVFPDYEHKSHDRTSNMRSVYVVSSIAHKVAISRRGNNVGTRNPAGSPTKVISRFMHLFSLFTVDVCVMCYNNDGKHLRDQEVGMFYCSQKFWFRREVGLAAISVRRCTQQKKHLRLSGN